MTSVLAALAATALLAPPAGPGTSAYCRKVQARATGDAALLMAPQLVLQALRFPAPGDVELFVAGRDETQLRAGLSFSPLDFRRGQVLLDTAEADCEQHEAAGRLQRLLLHAEEYGRLGAARAQVAFLEERRPAWEAVVARAERRHAARETTLVELTELRVRAADLERKLAQARGDLERLQAREGGEGPPPLPDLLAAFRQRADRYERAVGGLRRLDPWRVDLTGGVIPGDRAPEWYGVVQVGFSFGAFSRAASERRYQEARREELRGSWYELEPQLRTFRAGIAAGAAQARRELATVDREAAFLAATRGAVERSDAPSAPHVLATLALHEVVLGADRAYLSSLLGALAPLEESP